MSKLYYAVAVIPKEKFAKAEHILPGTRNIVTGIDAVVPQVLPCCDNIKAAEALARSKASENSVTCIYTVDLDQAPQLANNQWGIGNIYSAKIDTQNITNIEVTVHKDALHDAKVINIPRNAPNGTYTYMFPSKSAQAMVKAQVEGIQKLNNMIARTDPEARTNAQRRLLDSSRLNEMYKTATHAAFSADGEVARKGADTPIENRILTNVLQYASQYMDQEAFTHLTPLHNSIFYAIGSSGEVYNATKFTGAILNGIVCYPDKEALREHILPVLSENVIEAIVAASIVEHRLTAMETRNPAQLLEVYKFQVPSAYIPDFESKVSTTAAILQQFGASPELANITAIRGVLYENIYNNPNAPKNLMVEKLGHIFDQAECDQLRIAHQERHPYLAINHSIDSILPIIEKRAKNLGLQLSPKVLTAIALDAVYGHTSKRENNKNTYQASRSELWKDLRQANIQQETIGKLQKGLYNPEPDMFDNNDKDEVSVDD